MIQGNIAGEDLGTERYVCILDLDIGGTPGVSQGTGDTPHIGLDIGRCSVLRPGYGGIKPSIAWYRRIHQATPGLDTERYTRHRSGTEGIPVIGLDTWIQRDE